MAAAGIGAGCGATAGFVIGLAFVTGHFDFTPPQANWFWLVAARFWFAGGLGGAVVGAIAGWGLIR